MFLEIYKYAVRDTEILLFSAISLIETTFKMEAIFKKMFNINVGEGRRPFLGVFNHVTMSSFSYKLNNIYNLSQVCFNRFEILLLFYFLLSFLFFFQFGSDLYVLNQPLSRGNVSRGEYEFVSYLYECFHNEKKIYVSNIILIILSPWGK